MNGLTLTARGRIASASLGILILIMLAILMVMAVRIGDQRYCQSLIDGGYAATTIERECGSQPQD